MGYASVSCPWKLDVGWTIFQSALSIYETRKLARLVDDKKGDDDAT